MTSTPAPAPFEVHISDDDLSRLQRKLRDTEFPVRDVVPDAGWSYGVSLAWVNELRTSWLEKFDWRAAEREINRWHHYNVTLEGVRIHFIHQRSTRVGAIPLLLVHGWPGSFYEFQDVITALTDPPEGEPAFHVIVPSVPGFIFSSAPAKKGWTVPDTARLLDKLVTEVLGYPSYAAQGGDQGALICTALAVSHPQCKAIHLNMGAAPPPFPIALPGVLFVLPKWFSSRLLEWYFTPDELNHMTRSKDFILQGAAHLAVQCMQPALIGYALYDSPLGILTWIGEKYGTPLLNDPTRAISPDRILTTASLYYFSKSFHTSCVPYKENTSNMGSTRIENCLVGISVFAYDIVTVPRRWAEKWYEKNLVFWKRHDHGGHFAALDSPAELVADLREYLGARAALFAADSA